MRTTHTYATLAIPALAFQSVSKAIELAGPDYVARYIEPHHEHGSVIHFSGSEVGLVADHTVDEFAAFRMGADAPQVRVTRNASGFLDITAAEDTVCAVSIEVLTDLVTHHNNMLTYRNALELACRAMAHEGWDGPSSCVSDFAAATYRQCAAQLESLATGNTVGYVNPTLPTDDEFLRHFAWLGHNQIEGFETWQSAIAYANAQGYSLVPAEYHVPHWTTTMVMPELPTIYVMRRDKTFDRLTTAFDRKASQIGYPLFFKRATPYMDNNGPELDTARADVPPYPMADGLYFNRRTKDSWWLLTKVANGKATSETIEGEIPVQRIGGTWSIRYDETDALVIEAKNDSGGMHRLKGDQSRVTLLT